MQDNILPKSQYKNAGHLSLTRIFFFLFCLSPIESGKSKMGCFHGSNSSNEEGRDPEEFQPLSLKGSSKTQKKKYYEKVSKKSVGKRVWIHYYFKTVNALFKNGECIIISKRWMCYFHSVNKLFKSVLYYF